MNSLADSSPVSLETVLLVLGALLMVGALVSGLARRSFVSLAALFVVTGFVLGDGGLEVLDFSARSGFVHDLAILALVVILFRDGLEVEAEMLQREWRLPARKLALGMPITCVLIALLHALGRRARLARVVPRRLAALADGSGALLLRGDQPARAAGRAPLPEPRVGAQRRARAAGRAGLHRRARRATTTSCGGSSCSRTSGSASCSASRWPGWRRAWCRRARSDQSLYALGSAFAIYGIAVALEGNGLIAVFTGAITLGILRPDLRTSFEHRADDIVEIVKLGIFVVFGSLLTLDGLFGDGWAAVGLVVFTLVVARPVAIWISLAGTAVDAATKGFMAWFGPKGVATMTFSLLVLGQGIPDAARIFNLAALCVFASVLAHGLTDTPGSEWLSRREERPAPGRPGTPTRPAGDAPA